MSYPILIQQLDSLQVLPKPERFTELYFSEHTHLPAAVRVGAPQKITFITRNNEHQKTNYTYRIAVASAKKEQVITTGAFTLNHNEVHNTEVVQPIPAIDRRVSIKVVLEYEGFAFGDIKPQRQSQSIHYFVDVVGIPVGTQ